MILVALIIGIILIVAAVRGTQNQLFAALMTDVPGFVIWAAAIFAVGVIGFVPGLKPISRGLLALVLVVIVLNNYKAILAGFASVSSGQASPSTSNQAQPNASNPLSGINQFLSSATSNAGFAPGTTVDDLGSILTGTN